MAARAAMADVQPTTVRTGGLGSARRMSIPSGTRAMQSPVTAMTDAIELPLRTSMSLENCKPLLRLRCSVGPALSGRRLFRRRLLSSHRQTRQTKDDLFYRPA